MKFHLLKIKSIQRLTADSAQITFDVPAALHEEYSFLPGQYITLDINGERRDYSICESPLNKEWSIGVKAIEGGKISNYLVNDLSVGDELKVSTPNGRFTIPSKPNEKRTLIAFTAGSGITPIMSMAEYTLQTEEWVNFHIFYVNKDANSVMFSEKLDLLKSQYGDRLMVHLFYTQQEQENFIYNGRIDEKKFDLILNQLIDINEVDEAMLCGPEEMIFTLSKKINEAGPVGDEGVGDYPSNAFEERVGKYYFDSYDEIIGLLEGDEAYALVDIKGYDEKVLLVAESVYDDLLGHMATTEATPYTIKANGKATADSLLAGSNTIIEPVSKLNL